MTVGKKQLQIKIGPDGLIEAKTLGIKGQTCVDYLPLLEEMLDAKAVKSEYTEEYWQSEYDELPVEENVNKLK